MSTARSTVYAWAYKQLEANPSLSLEALEQRTIAHFEDDFDLLLDLARQGIQQTVASVVGSRRKNQAAAATQPTSPPAKPKPPARQPREQLRKEIERELAAMPADAPLARIDTSRQVKADVFADLASMTKLEVINFANQLSGESLAAAKMAELCRRIADDMNATERVADRFTREDLLRTMNRITINTSTTVFIGDRQVALRQGTR